MVTRTATTTAELTTAFGASAPGDIIEVAPGNYADYTASGYDFSAGAAVTLRSQTSTSHAVFRTLKLSGCKNIIVENITINPTNFTTNWGYVFHILACDTITVRYCNIVGTAYVSTASWLSVYPAAQRTFGYGKGIVYENSNNITIENNYLRHLFKGIDPVNRFSNAQQSNITIRYNMAENVDGDRMVMAGTNNALAEWNYFVNSRSDQITSSPDHVDGIIQGQAPVDAGNQVPMITNLTVRNNIVDQGNGTPTQIVFGRSEQSEGTSPPYPGLYHDNITVDDNLGIGSTTHGVSWNSALNLTARRNAMFRPSAMNPDPVLGNPSALAQVQCPALLSGFGTGPTAGVHTFDSNFARGTAGVAAGAILTNNLFKDPSLGQTDVQYSGLVTGFAATFNGAGDPYDPDHLNIIWPDAAGLIKAQLIGPTWWQNDAFAGPGPYNNGVQPLRPADTSLWGRVALAYWASGTGAGGSGGGGGSNPTLTGPSALARITVN